MGRIPEELWDKLVAGILMNLVAQEERHLMREAALAGKALSDDATINEIYLTTVENVVKRFPNDLRPHLEPMLKQPSLRAAIAKDIERLKDEPWLR